MLKLTSFACAAVLAAISLSAASAAPLTTNVAVGRVVVSRPNNVSPGIATSNRIFTPNVSHGPKQKPAVKKWVCGPIVNYDGSPHCHWVTH